jgi:hypothetical protein
MIALMEDHAVEERGPRAWLIGHHVGPRQRVGPPVTERRAGAVSARFPCA